MRTLRIFVLDKTKDMTDLQLYTKLSGLPLKHKVEVADFIDFLKSKSDKKNGASNKRVSGKAKGLIVMKDNFDDAIEGFNEYI